MASARSFASLMSLLDPTAISDPEDYTPDDFKSKGLVVRRFKKDIKEQVSADFRSVIRSSCGRTLANTKKPPTAPCWQFPSPKTENTTPANPPSCSAGWYAKGHILQPGRCARVRRKAHYPAQW